MAKRKSSPVANSNSEASNDGNNKKSRDTASPTSSYKTEIETRLEMMQTKMAEMEAKMEAKMKVLVAAEVSKKLDGKSSSSDTEASSDEESQDQKMAAVPKLDMSNPWNVRYQELKDYKELFGCDVPSNNVLATWSRLQRKQYKQLKEAGPSGSKMTSERVKLLNAIGFDWDAEDALANNRWEMRFAELMEYADENGHCRVPETYAENKQLGTWVFNQRQGARDLKKGKASSRGVTQEKIDRLTAIGFCFNPRKQKK